MANSLENACETFFVCLLKASPKLSGRTILHFGTEQKAKIDAIIVQAKEQNKNLAVPGMADVELVVEYRTQSKTPKATNELIVGAIVDAIYSSTLSNRARDQMARKSGLGFMVIRDDKTSDRQNSQDFRRWTMTFPLHAKPK